MTIHNVMLRRQSARGGEVTAAHDFLQKNCPEARERASELPQTPMTARRYDMKKNPEEKEHACGAWIMDLSLQKPVDTRSAAPP